MHDGFGVGPFAVHGEMQECLLGRLVAGQQVAGGRQPGNARRVEPAHAGIGRRDQQAVLDAVADIAGRAAAITALEQRFSMQSDPLA